MKKIVLRLKKIFLSKKQYTWETFVFFAFFNGFYPPVRNLLGGVGAWLLIAACFLLLWFFPPAEEPSPEAPIFGPIVHASYVDFLLLPIIMSAARDLASAIAKNLFK